LHNATIELCLHIWRIKFICCHFKKIKKFYFKIKIYDLKKL
jgi:hypothetical protein